MPSIASKLVNFGWYVSLMSLASALSLLRGFLIAGLLDLESFGRYATLVATGMFFSSILSFGELEKTIKLFPRLWVEGKFQEVVKNTDQSVNKLIARVALISYILFGCLIMGFVVNQAKSALLIILVSLNAAVAGIYASAIRSTGKTNILSRNTLTRSSLVLIFAAAGAFYFTWYGAILGEALGFLLGSMLTRASLKKQMHNDVTVNPIKVNQEVTILKASKYWLFFATLCVSAPAFLDRAFISMIYGNSTVGTQGFLMLFVTGASTLTGIVGQKVGPQLIKMQHSGDKIDLQMKYGFRWVFLIWSILIIGLTIVFLMLTIGPASGYFDKFNLNLNLLFATGALCLLQISVISDYLIISKNNEKGVFFAALCYFLAISSGGFVIWWLKPSLAIFVWMLVGCKFLHLMMQTVVTGCLWRNERVSYS